MLYRLRKSPVGNFHMGAHKSCAMLMSKFYSIQVKKCQLCTFISPNLRYLLKHIRQVHAHEPGFHLTCGFSGCPRTFRTFEVFRNHIYDHHTDSESILIPDNEEESTPVEIGDEEIQPEYCEQANSRMKSAAVWILKVQETHGIPQSTMMEIIKDVTGFVQDLLVDLYSDVKSVLTSAGITNDVPGLQELFNSESTYAHPFQGLESPYKQLKFLKEVFNFVVHIIIIM